MDDLLCWFVHRWWGQLGLLAALWAVGYVSWKRGLERGAELPFSGPWRVGTRQRLNELDAAEREDEETEDEELAEEQARRAAAGLDGAKPNPAELVESSVQRGIPRAEAEKLATPYKFESDEEEH